MQNEKLSEIVAKINLTQKIIDEEVTFSQEMLQLYFEARNAEEANLDAKEALRRKIDAIHSLMENFTQNASLYRSRAEKLDAVAKRFEKSYESICEYAKFIIKQSPDTEFRGTEVQFFVRKNPPSLECNFSKPISISNSVPNEFANLVPNKYLKSKTVYFLDTETLKTDMKNGIANDFASLNVKERLIVKTRLFDEK